MKEVNCVSLNFIALSFLCTSQEEGRRVCVAASFTSSFVMRFCFYQEGRRKDVLASHSLLPSLPPRRTFAVYIAGVSASLHDAHNGFCSVPSRFSLSQCTYISRWTSYVLSAIFKVVFLFRREEYPTF